jgi:hypothetical protein
MTLALGHRLCRVGAQFLYTWSCTSYSSSLSLGFLIVKWGDDNSFSEEVWALTEEAPAGQHSDDFLLSPIYSRALRTSSEFPVTPSLL